MRRRFITLTMTNGQPALVRADAVVGIYPAEPPPSDVPNDVPGGYVHPVAYVAIFGAAEELAVLETAPDVERLVDEAG